MTPPTDSTPLWNRLQTPLRLVGGGTLLALSAATGLYLLSLHGHTTIAGLRAGAASVGGSDFAALDAPLQSAAAHFLDGKLTIAVGSGCAAGPGPACSVRKVTRREAGFSVDLDELRRRVEWAGRSGHPFSDIADRVRARRDRLDLPLPVRVDRARALDFLGDIKDDVDRAPTDAHLDLERHTVAPDRPGFLLRVYDALVAMEYAAAAGSVDRVVLPALETPPGVKAADLTAIDISTVLGNWETRYSASQVDTDRTYNLKVGADKLNGHILKPHEIFSFNKVVGDRTEKEGYRVAPVIQGGELIDGLAGGMCQIASTLHAASFFAGLEIISSTPHSRPSAYIPMGLDSTVVYPTTDLKLRNPYDFPVVMHYSVNQGAVRVELLGKERPVQIVFEREIKTETPFGASARRTPHFPSGQRVLLQDGYPGYSLIRRRYIFPKEALPPKGLLGNNKEILAESLARAQLKPLKKEQWALHYPSTEKITGVGSGPAGKPKDPPPSHHIPTIPPSDKPLFRIVK